jgi:hypothetical protein
MTSSNKTDLSPRLLDKVRTMLLCSTSFSEAESELKQSPALNPQHKEGFALAKPEQMMNLHDISAIQPNQYVIDSFDNASLLKRKPNERVEIRFDVICDSTSVGRPTTKSLRCGPLTPLSVYLGSTSASSALKDKALYVS